MIDLENAKKEFLDYTSQFDKKNKNIERKIGHSLRVMEISAKISKTLNLNQEEEQIASLIGLLHDIGRFKQYSQYQTFQDSKSIDHGKLGVEILLKENQIQKYVKDSKMKDGEEIKQYGADGAKSITYKILKYNGIVVSKTVLSEDIYSALDRIIKTGKENSEVISTSGILIDKEQLNELNPELLNNIKELN